jgi:hypothetical protein
MVDWNTGAPNARFRVLELLKNHFVPGSRLVETAMTSRDVYALGFVDPSGKHKLLLVNKRNAEVALTLPQHAEEVVYVDQTTCNGPPKKEAMRGNSYTLRGFAVALVTLGKS